MINRREPDPRRHIPERRTDERRDADRHESETGVRFMRAGGSADAILHGELIDVSESGVRIILDTELLLTDKLLIEVRDFENRCHNLTAQVIRIEPADGNRYEIGCELCVNLSPQQCKLLRDFAKSSRMN